MGGHITLFTWIGGNLYHNFSWKEFSKMQNYADLICYVSAFSPFNDKLVTSLIEMNEEHQKNLDFVLTG
jgi:hypothetical protein